VRARTFLCLLFGAALWSGSACLESVFAADTKGSQFFERRIRPVLVRECYECHSVTSKEPKGELRLDSRDAARKGGESGPAVVPGKVGESLLIDAIQHKSFEMPPKKKLPDNVIADFVKWIEMGAPDPRDHPPNPKAAAAMAWQQTYEQRRQWWSLQPLVNPPVPSADKKQWSNQPIDRFVLSKLHENELEPADPADRQTLIRRLSVVLLGLPPKPDDVGAFVNDHSPTAYERVVDRLLASPHFGERWARHWMDVVRYTDTYGYEWDIPAKGAWRYRDYLTRALNQDVSFDQLVREQIAGDLLRNPRINQDELINESLIGTMFFQMGEKRHGDSSEFNGIHQEMLDNKIDAFSKAFQAMTISCARCHDHKLDAVAQREYYALAGVLMSSRWVTNTADLPQRNADVIRELKGIKAKLRTQIAAVWRADITEFSDKLVAASSDSPRAGEWSRLIESRRKNPPPIEDPLSIWMKLITAKDNITESWKTIAANYSSESKKRVTANANHFKVAVDFRDGIPDGWSVDGVALQDVVACGDFNVNLDGEAVIGRLQLGGLMTSSLSPRLNGVVRTPYLNTFKNGHISFEVSGGDFSAYRTVIDNAFLTEKQVYLKHDDPRWILMSTRPSMKERHIFIEFSTKTSNPNFPPRVGLGGACSEQQAADPRSWFCLSRVVLHEAGQTPVNELRRFLTLLEGKPPTTLEQAAQRYAAWFQKAVQSWSDGKADDDDVRLINSLLDNKLLTNNKLLANHRLAHKLAEIGNLLDRYRKVEQQIRIPWTVNGMADVDTGYDYRLNVRGDYDQLGDEIPRGYVQVLSQGSHHAGRDRVRHEASANENAGSGRLDLAELVASPNNPLTARVFVNRVWQWLFGAGLVTTPNDFGHLGEPPSHPELLDYLAHRFIQEGWSIKKLVRSIVLTETWRQDGRTSEKARTVDPKNRLLHHYSLRRLEAEAIRDAMLANSGRLDERLYGRPINPPRSKEDPQKRLFSGPVDGNGRRSIYTKITIMEPPRLLATFNQPEPKIPTGKRDVTTTPAQSLTLLNDPFVSGQAQFWAQQLVTMKHATLSDRLAVLFRTAFARNPTNEEINRWSTAVGDLAALHGVNQDDQLQSLKIWNDVAHAIFNTKEFIYIR